MRHHAVLAILTALGAGPFAGPELLTTLPLGLGLLGLGIIGTKRRAPAARQADGSFASSGSTCSV
jgi:hypothetical protein